MNTSSLKRSTISSIGWTIARVGWTNGAAFLLFVVLTRLLDPVSFGIFALSTVFVDIARVLSTAGLADAIMREPELSEETADTAFWSNLGFACIVMLATLALARPYAAFMGQVEVGRVISVLALLMPVAALGAIHTARLQRQFGHKALALRTMLASLAASIAAIGAALAGAGVWSLVVQAVVIDVAQLALALWTFRWRPRLRFSTETLVRLLGFSGSMVATQLLWLFLMRVPELFIGRMLGTAAVGRFRVSWRLIDLLGQTLLTPMGSVSLITLARVQADPERFRRIWVLMVVGASLLVLPTVFGLGAVADDLIPLMFGQHWSGNGDLVRIMALVAPPFVVNAFVPAALGALGHSRDLFKIALFELVITLVAAWIGARFGLLAITLACSVRTWAIMPYQLVMLHRRSGLAIGELLRRVSGATIAAALMATLVYATGRYGHAHGLSPIATLAVQIPLGVGSYALLMLLLARGEVGGLIAMLRGRAEGAQPA